jgi:hypothetical protein
LFFIGSPCLGLFLFQFRGLFRKGKLNGSARIWQAVQEAVTRAGPPL